MIICIEPLWAKLVETPECSDAPRSSGASAVAVVLVFPGIGATIDRRHVLLPGVGEGIGQLDFLALLRVRSVAAIRHDVLLPIDGDSVVSPHAPVPGWNQPEGRSLGQTLRGVIP
jgi:hypothetical protein